MRLNKFLICKLNYFKLFLCASFCKAKIRLSALVKNLLLQIFDTASILLASISKIKFLTISFYSKQFSDYSVISPLQALVIEEMRQQSFSSVGFQSHEDKRPKQRNRCEVSESTTFFCKKKGTPIFLCLLFSFNTAYAIDLDPDGKPIKEGIERYSYNDFQGALENFSEAEKNFKEDARINFNKGTAYYKLNDFENAKKSFEKSISTEDKNLKANSFYNLGNTYSKLNDKKNAIKSYMNALNENPNLSEARKNIELLNKEEDKDKKKDKQDDKDQEQNKDKNQNEKSKDQKKKQNKNGEDDKSDKNQTPENKGLTKEEAEKILEQLGKDKINRKKTDQGRNESSEIFW